MIIVNGDIKVVLGGVGDITAGAGWCWAVLEVLAE